MSACWYWQGRRSATSPTPRPAWPRELAGADVVAAEDTRRLRRLAQALGVTVAGRVVSYFEGNESARTPELVEALLGGARVAAGHRRRDALGLRPGLPAGRRGRGRRHPGHRGARPVRGADRAGAVGGLPVDRFCFEGFLPRKAGERRAGCASSPPSRRTTGLLRGAAPARGHAGRDGGGLRRRTAPGRGLPRADQDVRGGPPRRPARSSRRGRPRAYAARSPSWSPGADRPSPPTRPTWWPRSQPLVAAGCRLKEASGDVAARRHRPDGVDDRRCPPPS